ncbi:MAG TPA: hypothetical protein VMO78_04705, partial [Rhizomicrobium sp.]|nr:hypothetical protein [Rhizomicrobium sp.]
ITHQISEAAQSLRVNRVVGTICAPVGMPVWDCAKQRTLRRRNWSKRYPGDRYWGIVRRKPQPALYRIYDGRQSCGARRQHEIFNGGAQPQMHFTAKWIEAT